MSQNKQQEQEQQTTELAAEWCTGKRTACERYVRLFETGNGVDVYFMVGKPGERQELIAAHKLLLSAGCDVFEAQFRHDNSNIVLKKGSMENPIPVIDIGPDAFRAMLKFVYADDFGGVTKHNVIDVYFAAKKYLLHRLVEKCLQSLSNGTNLDASDVLSVLKQAQRAEEKEIIDHCWTFVEDNAKAVLKSEQFLAMEQQDLCKLVSRDDLNTDELFLFERLHDWAIRKCETLAHEPTAENKRAVVGEAIDNIRFPIIMQQDFAMHIALSGLLNKDDVNAMLIYFNVDDEARRQNPVRFSCAFRRTIYYPHGYTGTRYVPQPSQIYNPCGYAETYNSHYSGPMPTNAQSYFGNIKYAVPMPTNLQVDNAWHVIWQNLKNIAFAMSLW